MPPCVVKKKSWNKHLIHGSNSPLLLFGSFNYSNNEIFVRSHRIWSKADWNIFQHSSQCKSLQYLSFNQFHLLFVYTFFTTSSRIKKAFVPSTAHVTKPPNLSFILNLMILGWEEKQEKMESCPWKTWCLCQGNQVNRGRRRRYEISVKGM